MTFRETHQSYRALLKRPEWIRFSKALKESRDNQCSVCGRYEHELERSGPMDVHHMGYRKDTFPWDYPEEELAVVCRECHDELHHYADELWNESLRTTNCWLIYESVKSVMQRLNNHYGRPWRPVGTPPPHPLNSTHNDP